MTLDISCWWVIIQLIGLITPIKGVGDVKQASRCFTLAIAADPDHGEAMVNLAILKHREGN